MIAADKASRLIMERPGNWGVEKVPFQKQLTGFWPKKYLQIAISHPLIGQVWMGSVLFTKL